MAEYTSGQYKYLLFQRLRRSFSMRDQRGRAYTQSFFWALFEGVTVTEAAYNNFVSLMDEQLDYLAQKGIYLCENIPSKDVEDGSLLLIDAFAEIGIELSISSGQGDGSYYAVFQKPDGKTLTYTVTMLGDNYFYINSRAGTEMVYARMSAASYNMDGMTVEDGDDLDPRIAGPGTYWSYAADTQTMTIAGAGAYAGATTEEQLGSGAYTTLILGANVSRLLQDSLSYNLSTIVLLQSADAPIAIDSGAADSKHSSAWVVYTDNLAFRNYSWPSSISIEWHPLSDWEG